MPSVNFIAAASAALAALSIGQSACAGTVRHNAAAMMAQTDATGSDVGRLGLAPFIIANEHAIYRLTYSGIEVGRIELRTGESGIVDGRRAIITWSETRSDGIVAVVVRLREQVLTTINLDTGIPISRQGSFAGLFSGREGEFPTEAVPWRDPDGHNTHAAVAMLRAWDPPPGTHGYFSLVVDGYRSRVEVVAAGRELIDTEDGKQPAVRIEGSVVGASRDGGPANFVMWFSDDKHRKLLRLDSDTDFGGILSLVLVSYDRP